MLACGAAPLIMLLVTADAQARTDLAPADPVMVAAGEIAGKGRGDTATARLLDKLAPSAVLALGDNAAPRGTAHQFKAFYRPTLGPSQGDHAPGGG
jgi:acid phosphatase type 7